MYTMSCKVPTNQPLALRRHGVIPSRMPALDMVAATPHMQHPTQPPHCQMVPAMLLVAMLTQVRNRPWVGVRAHHD